MNKEELQMLGFEIVAYSGDARSTLMTLLSEVRQGTKILADEAAGSNLDIGFIFIHGQDHLMTTLLLRDLVQDFIELYKDKFQG